MKTVYYSYGEWTTADQPKEHYHGPSNFRSASPEVGDRLDTLITTGRRRESAIASLAEMGLGIDSDNVIIALEVALQI